MDNSCVIPLGDNISWATDSQLIMLAPRVLSEKN